MRLIDAEDWENRLRKFSNDLPDGKLKSNIESLINDIMTQPTAFDVDKVVEKLQDNTHFNWNMCYFIPEEAIEIVKGGGIKNG